jgi:hypothetical protein
MVEDTTQKIMKIHDNVDILSHVKSERIQKEKCPKKYKLIRN